MKCPVCGNSDGGCDKKPEGAKFFCITLRSRFEEYSVDFFLFHLFN